MKVIVHIGTEKTGTSSIQMFLYRNRKKLMKSGYHFLQSAGETNNWALPALFSVDERFHDLYRDEGIRTKQQIDEFKLKFFQKFESEIRSLKKNIHTVIISSEHFHSRIRTKEEMNGLHQFLSRYFDAVKIVCYLREQVATCTSWYSTSMKSGGTLSLEGFIQRCRPRNYYFNYYEVLSNWESHFGFESMHVALFSQDQLLNRDLLDDFTSRLDPALVGSLNKSIETENESLKPAGQALARALNIVFPVSSERAEVNDLRYRCKKIIFQGLTGRGQQLELDERKRIFDSFIESNERVRKKYFAEVETLFSPPLEAALPGDPVDEIAFGVLSDVLTVLKKYGKGILSSRDYAQVCNEILASFGDVTRVVGCEKVVSTDLTLSKDEARLLRSAALQIEGRDLESANKLAMLASKIWPNLPGITSKLEEYSQKREVARKYEYILTYHGGDMPPNPDEAERIVARWQKWTASLDVPVGGSAIRIKGTTTVSLDGIVANTDQSSPVGFSIFKAESLEDALAIAKKCPFLELGGTLEVSEFGNL